MAGKYFLSLSGGKDSILALYLALEEGLSVDILFSMGNEKWEGPHKVPAYLIERMGECLGIPVKIAYASWEEYEKVFSDTIESFKKDDYIGGVFGDMDILEHRKWCEDVLGKVEMEASFPLWGKSREEVARLIVDKGFKAMITYVDKEKASTKYIGRFLDHNTIDEMINEGIDPSGEGGEFHTLVVDGPIFKKPLEYVPVKIYQDEKVGYIEYQEN